MIRTNFSPKIFSFLLLIILFQSSLNADPILEDDEYSQDTPYDIDMRRWRDSSSLSESWVKRDGIDDETWEAAVPYLLPFDSPLRKKLDKIFSKTRATASFHEMEKAGFDCWELRQWSNILVAKHHRLQGYLIKTYLDDQHGINDFFLLKKRIDGAILTHASIKKFGYQTLFKAPKKWLYPLPDYPACPPGLSQKHFILVVKDMKVDHSSRDIWHGNKKVSVQRLKALYDVVTDVGLFDSLMVSNIPFCKDGRNAFLDTEHFGKSTIPYHKLNYALNPEKQAIWNEIVEKGNK